MCIYITFQKFYRVTGSSTQHKGVNPDINLPSAYDAEHYGESATPNALPWDVISAASYQKSLQVNKSMVDALSSAYLDRTKFDVSLKKYISDTELLKKNLAQTRISLNETKRKQEVQEAEKSKADEKLDTKLTTKEGLPTDELLKLKDEYLREGLLILGDLIKKRIG